MPKSIRSAPHIVLTTHDTKLSAYVFQDGNVIVTHDTHTHAAGTRIHYGMDRLVTREHWGL